jgi:hypothetical protein
MDKLKQLSNTKKIFTFWEPKEKLHPYLKLCIQTWQKFLPDYEIIIVDYSDLDDLLGKDYYDRILYSDFSLAKQADAIRCSLLKKYGGIWLDTDTIVTSEKVRDILNTNADFTLINRHIGFIVAKQNIRILQDWEKGIKRRLFIYKMCKNFKIINSLFSLVKWEYRQMHSWDSLGNSILNRYLDWDFEKSFVSLDRLKLKALPEMNWSIENNINLKSQNLYHEFYFENDFSDYALADSFGIIYLHNSWTPDKYKQMTKEELLKHNITLSNIFKAILGI